MRILGLISGGKDSLHNLLLSSIYHEPVCLGHLTYPKEKDSYMY